MFFRVLSYRIQDQFQTKLRPPQTTIRHQIVTQILEIKMVTSW
jgi:hypothetical protein